MTDLSQVPALSAEKADLKIKSTQKPARTKTGPAQRAKGGTGNDGDRFPQLVNFATFKRYFIEELSSPDFGEDTLDTISVTEKSAGALELEKTRAARVLRNLPFLRSVHREMREYIRLTKERARIKTLGSKSGRRIRELRNVRNTLRAMCDGIDSVITRLEKFTEEKKLGQFELWELRDRLITAQKQLRNVEDDMLDLEKFHGSKIHPEIRAKHDKSSRTDLKFHLPRWRSLIPPYEYELTSLKKRTPQQWLTERLYRLLRDYLKTKNIKLTRATRYRLVSAFVETSGLPRVSVGSVKEHLVQKRRLKSQAVPARNS